MDPITGAIVSYLSTTAAGMAAGATAEAGKLMISDAYKALKGALKKKFGAESKTVKAVAELEQEPDFRPNQEALAGRLEQAGAADDKDLLKLAAALVEALKQSADGQAALAKYAKRININAGGDVIFAKDKSTAIQVKNARVGVIGDHAKIDGGIDFGNSK